MGNTCAYQRVFVQFVGEMEEMRGMVLHWMVSRVKREAELISTSNSVDFFVGGSRRLLTECHMVF